MSCRITSNGLRNRVFTAVHTSSPSHRGRPPGPSDRIRSFR